MAELNKKFRDSKYYINRELSWLKFNERCLNEARDNSTPLFERLKFLSITASNLDEFFMVRVASLKDMVHAGYKKEDISGLTPKQQLDLLYEATHDFVEKQYDTYLSLLPKLKQNGLRVVQHHEDLTPFEAEFVDRYFETEVYPVLTPMAVDSSRPFPLVRNKSLNLAALISKKDNHEQIDFAMVQVPSVLPRIVVLPADDEPGSNATTIDGQQSISVILLGEIIERNISSLFLNYDVISAHPFRIMRSADLEIDEDEAEDLLKEIEKQIKKRAWGHAIRLEVEDGIDDILLDRLERELDITDDEIFKIKGPLDLTFLMKLYGMKGFDKYKSVTFTPGRCRWLTQNGNLFEQIRQGDILLFHPYESFDPVVDFVRSAAKDPDVLAIKQTLYRVSGNSPIIAALERAAEAGKQVTVLVELKARFDEENNIVWAKKLEKAGVHVIYGLVGLKTHSKITLVVRKEEEGIRRYVHLGTGNYNDSTAKIYTDMGLLTCSESIGEDATAVFNMLSGYSEPLNWNKLSLAPLWLKDKFLYMIRRERDNAIDGKEARIIAKMNALCDPDIIEALYEASYYGVKIDLIIRGICCLRAGVEGVSDNITVRSIVGNFLEHSRIFYFEAGGRQEYYMGSADWMPRNLERRVEILFPVERDVLKEELKEILNIMLNDNMRSSLLKCDGTYEKKSIKGKDKIDCQEIFVRMVAGYNKENNVFDDRVFIPKISSDKEVSE